MGTLKQFQLLVIFFLTEVIPFSFAVGGDDDGDLLAQILADEKREEEEYKKLFEREATQASYHKRPTKPETDAKKKRMPKGANINLSGIEEELRLREAAAAASRAAEEERMSSVREEANRIKREAKFASDLQKLDKKQAKIAKRKKKGDARIVRRILNAVQKGKYYSVLGLRNMELKIGPWHIFHVKTRDVKKAYRNLARLVHPDKNCDGRAEKAFEALEKAAGVLSDITLREEYDRKSSHRIREQRKEMFQRAFEYFEAGSGVCVSVSRLTTRIIGPFFIPMSILGALVI